MCLGAMSLSLTRYNFTVIIVFRVSSSPAIPFLFLFALARMEQHFRNSYPDEQDVGLKKREGQDDQCGRRGHGGRGEIDQSSHGKFLCSFSLVSSPWRRFSLPLKKFRCKIFACIQGKVEMEDQRMERLLMERESKMLPEELKTVVDVLRFGLFFSIFTTTILFLIKVFLDNSTITSEQFK